MSTAVVGIVMGSDSDLSHMEGAVDILKKFGVPYEMTVASAHRSPARSATYAHTAEERGLKVIIAGAGMAAALPGVMAAESILPVIGVPISSSPLNGMDAIMSMVQMPPGIPVAAMALDKGGAKNAALLAIQILALNDDDLKDKMRVHKMELARGVEEKAKKIEALAND